MAGMVAAMDVRMATALAGAVPNVAAFCREQHISRQTFYKWRTRFSEGGVDGLAERSRRPLTAPNATPSAVAELVVRVRKELSDVGADSGPESIRSAMLTGSLPCCADDGASTGLVPSRATISRILTRRGLAVAQPQKRPRSSMHHFVYARPNECWQSDWTELHLADGQVAAVAATLDDHSRKLLGIGAALGAASAELVWSVMAAAIASHGVPVRSLTDNGWVYSGYRRGVRVAFETNLQALGSQTICSTPYHPQTCGKVERHWQTMKRWLTAHGPYPELGDLQAALSEYQDYYNNRRPHRALQHHTPAAAYAATIAARPAPRPLPARVIVTTTLISHKGAAAAAGYLIGVGYRWIGHTLTAIADGDHIALFAGNRLVRVLDADPTRKYQPIEPAHRTPRGHREPAQ